MEKNIFPESVCGWTAERVLRESFDELQTLFHKYGEDPYFGLPEYGVNGLAGSNYIKLLDWHFRGGPKEEILREMDSLRSHYATLKAEENILHSG